jgi:hypothetical protein
MDYFLSSLPPVIFCRYVFSWHYLPYHLLFLIDMSLSGIINGGKENDQTSN